MNATETATAPERKLDTATAFQVVQFALSQFCGRDVEISPDTQIVQFFNDEFGPDGPDLIDLILLIEEAVGVRLTPDDWEYLSGERLCKSPEDWEARYAGMFTFGRLADLVAARAPHGPIKPITILGSTSRAAGAFRMMQRIANALTPSVELFGPSTPILDRLNGGNLRTFWNRVRAYAPARVPALGSASVRRITSSLLERRGAPLCVFGSIIATLAAGLYIGAPYRLGWPGYLFVAALLGLLFSGAPAIVLWGICKIAPSAALAVRHTRGLLPNGIETFGDLARLAAGERGGWCDECGYDLTGLESDRCPECGQPLRGVTPPPRLSDPINPTLP